MKDIRNIDQITTRELIDELCKRCAPAIFIGYKPEESGDNVFWNFSGAQATCYGLCHQMAYLIQREMISTEVKGDEDA